jgi:hypothetical protein
MKASLTDVFVNDWEPASESLHQEATDGIADVAYIALIEKIDEAPKAKRGKSGFRLTVELTDHEKQLLQDEAKYRMEFWSMIYQDDKSEIDKPAHRAAKKLFLELGGVITPLMAERMGV